MASHDDPAFEHLSPSDLSFEFAKTTLKLVCQMFANMDDDVLKGCLNHLRALEERENPRPAAKKNLSTVLRGV